MPHENIYNGMIGGLTNHKNSPNGTMIYGDKQGQPTHDGDQLYHFTVLNRVLKEAAKYPMYGTLIKRIKFDKNKGKVIKAEKLVPLLSDENVASGGTDRNGIVIVNGNAYGGSPDIKTIKDYDNSLSEIPGRANKVSFTRQQIQTTIQKNGIFMEFTQDNVDFGKLNATNEYFLELVKGAVQMIEDNLQIRLIEAAGIGMFGGTGGVDFTPAKFDPSRGTRTPVASSAVTDAQLDTIHKNANEAFLGWDADIADGPNDINEDGGVARAKLEVETAKTIYATKQALVDTARDAFVGSPPSSSSRVGEGALEATGLATPNSGSAPLASTYHTALKHAEVARVELINAEVVLETSREAFTSAAAVDYTQSILSWSGSASAGFTSTIALTATITMPASGANRVEVLQRDRLILSRQTYIDTVTKQVEESNRRANVAQNNFNVSSGLTSMGSMDSDGIVTHKLLSKMSSALDKNGCSYDTTIRTGANLTDTLTVPNTRYMLIHPDMEWSFRNVQNAATGKADVFIPYEKIASQGSDKYGSSINPFQNRTIGTCGKFTIVVVPTAKYYQGAGAEAVDVNTRSTNGNYNIYPSLVVGSNSCSGIDFTSGNAGKTMQHADAKTSILELREATPSAVTTSHPHGSPGVKSLGWWEGLLVERPDWIAVMYTVGTDM